ncbi:hypothetical protein TWF281_005902 [Arthrobotrys megalospora]
MPPPRVSSFASLDEIASTSPSPNPHHLTSRSQSTSLRQSTSSGSGSNNQPQQVLVRSLPSGGRTRGPRRIISLESIPEAPDQRTINSLSRGIARSTNPRPNSTPIASSGSSGVAGNQLSTARATGIARHSVRIPNISYQTGNRQILRQGRTYVPPTNNRASGIPNYRQAPVGNRRITNPMDEHVWQPNSGNGSLSAGRYSGGSAPGGRYSGGQTFRGDMPQRRSSLQPQTSTKLPATGHGSKQVVDPENDEDLEGLEVVGKRTGKNGKEHADSRASTGVPSPEKEPKSAQACDPSEYQEGRVTRRQNDLPVVVYPQPGTEPEGSGLKARRPLRNFESPKSGRLALEYSPLGEDEEDWVDEESWHCSDEEGAETDSDSDDSDSDEDFGCIGLFKEEYEEMLKAGKGFNQELVEEVDNWPVPPEIKNLGYRVVGRLGEEAELQREMAEEYKESEEYKMLRKHRWLEAEASAGDTGDDDEEWEDE